MTTKVNLLFSLIISWTFLNAQVKTYTIDPTTVLPIDFYLQDRKPIEYLFSPTGDTLLWPVDNKVYIYQIKNKKAVDLDSFLITPNLEKITINDYPVEFLKKYNLKQKGQLLNPDSITSISANFKILKNYKISKSFWSSELNFYRLNLAVTIKICDKIILDNYKFSVEYESDSKRNDFKFSKSEVIEHLIKIDNNEEYYLSINIIESFFNFETTALYKAQNEVSRSVLMKEDIIMCH